MCLEQNLYIILVSFQACNNVFVKTHLREFTLKLRKLLEDLNITCDCRDSFTQKGNLIVGLAGANDEQSYSNQLMIMLLNYGSRYLHIQSRNG